jgi:nitroimidazol reductase NimA-like FMN-containing flavoprotein (pyridoxamine 5'-phosphate oxidase superfamily)
MSELSVTARTRHRRLREQGRTGRRDLDDVLRDGVICHLGVIVDGYPMVVPTVYGVAGDTLYFHGSVASRSLVTGPAATVTDPAEKVTGLRALSEHIVPGQWDYARAAE